MGLFDNLFGKGLEKQNDKPGAYPSNIVYSPLKGEAIPLSQVSDPAFSEGLMGPGLAITPTEGKLYSPVNGTIVTVFPTKHALGLLSDSGMEILIHIGIDTVSMGGDGFEAFVQSGDKVGAGKLLVEFDIDKIINSGYEAVTMLIITNHDKLNGLVISGEGNLEVLDEIMKLGD